MSPGTAGATAVGFVLIWMLPAWPLGRRAAQWGAKGGMNNGFDRAGVGMLWVLTVVFGWISVALWLICSALAALGDRAIDR